MKIDSIRARNVIGARDINAPLGSVNLICARNGQGKSSIQESVRLAFQGETVRVSLKRDYPLLVTEGAKEGFVKLVADGETFEYRLPAGEHITPDGWGENLQLRCVLDAQRFTDMSADDRRAFLTILTKSKPNPEKIKELMLEAKIDEARIELALPMLRSGFPAACEIAKQKAQEAKGAWKAIAGGVWGSKKGEDWTAPDVDAPEQADIDLSAAYVTEQETALADAQQQLGATVQKINANNEKASQIEAAKAKAAMLPRMRDKLVRDEASLAEYEAALATLHAHAGTGPREGLVHDMARFINTLTIKNIGANAEVATRQGKLLGQYEREHGSIDAAGDAEAAAKIPSMEKTVQLMKSSVTNGKRDIAAAEQAEANLAVIGTLEDVTGDLLEKVKADVATINAELQTARQEHKTMLDLKKAADERDSRTKLAAQHHQDVVGWLAVAEQFAPDGLPSQILSKALEPINKLLREYATATEWFQVTIRTDMEILANNRLLTLLSESEKWMVNAHICAAIAELSGLKLLMLDRFDVLDVGHRAQLLYWLDDMAYDHRLDTSLIFGTLKEEPKGLPDTITVFWIESGELANAMPMAQAA